MKYKPTKESIKKHQVPDWFHDAKFGIFINWGIYSVPAFAVTGVDLVGSMKKGIEEHFKNNTYAEWYLNSLRIAESPTQTYHNENYGKDFSYDDFAPIFNEEVKKWNPDEWVELFKKAGAKYVVLVTKHHDGFTLWPSKYPNPKKKEYFASRDIVGELTEAVKKTGMKMGLYYSGALDWSWNPNPIKDGKTFTTNGSSEIEYTRYANNHWYELIDNYDPIILWNDIGYPPNTNVYEIFSYFYNIHKDGLVNDRWRQYHKSEFKHPKVRHWDFVTPEYEKMPRITNYKWESTRGVGFSYGYNKKETEKDYLSSKELIHMFVDIVSKNGNLLLNLGPRADGSIPEPQQKAILGLGKWLEINGEAIYGTRPWIKAEGFTQDNIDVRYTKNTTSLYAILLGQPIGNELVIKTLTLKKDSKIELLGYDVSVKWNQVGENITIILSNTVSDSPAYAFKITPLPLTN
jgi:alpha-L-fucosidase